MKNRDNLNEQQKKAITTTEGRVLVLAGAGSGKTRVIVERIAYLVNALHVPPSLILGLTFTNKAAQEMRERLKGLIAPQVAKQVTLSTFHSFCLMILRKEIHSLGYTENFSLYDEKDRHRLITQILKDHLKEEKALPSIEPIIDAIVDAKNRGGIHASVKCNDPLIRQAYEDLQQAFRAYNALDFDSLIPETLQLFEKVPSVLKKVQQQYRYVMIDEYQDTNPVQFQLANLLSQKSGNLFVVGDDDQSIYGWRGAEIKNILEFQSDTVIKLEQNYRCFPHILQAANALIANNQGRHKKQLWSAKPDTEKILVFHSPTEEEEAEAIVKKLVAFHDAGVPWKEMAILYRSNILARNLEVALLKGVYRSHGAWLRGIPHQVFGGLPFSQRAEVKDLFAYLRLILNPQDSEALLRIINVPRRGISTASLDRLTHHERTTGLGLWTLLKEAPLEELGLQTKAIQGIRAWREILEEAQARFSKESLSATFLWLVKAIDYERAIREEVKSDKMRKFKLENVEEIANALAQYEEEAEEPSLQDFLGTSLLNQESPYTKQSKQEKDAVNLMTFHSAKGLEFEVCILMGLEDHILPHEKSMKETGIEEERRLFYVGITRAKKHLLFSMARTRRKMGKKIATQPSRFLFEIPKTLLKTAASNNEQNV